MVSRRLLVLTTLLQLSSGVLVCEFLHRIVLPAPYKMHWSDHLVGLLYLMVHIGYRDLHTSGHGDAPELQVMRAQMLQNPTLWRRVIPRLDVGSLWPTLCSCDNTDVRLIPPLPRMSPNIPKIRGYISGCWGSRPRPGWGGMGPRFTRDPSTDAKSTKHRQCYGFPICVSECSTQVHKGPAGPGATEMCRRRTRRSRASRRRRKRAKRTSIATAAAGKARVAHVGQPYGLTSGWTGPFA